MTTTILIIVNVFSALAIIVLALMQQSKGDMGSAFGGGGSQSMFGSRGSANFLSRTTAVMCAVFFISSLSLAYTYSKRAEDSSVIPDSSVIQQSTDVPTIENAVPTIESDVPSIEGDIPVVGGDGSSIEATIDSGVPSIPESDDAADAVEGAVEAATDGVPEVPGTEGEVPEVPNN